MMDPSRVKLYALRRLAAHAYSSHSLRELLKRKKIPEEIIEKTLTDLTEEGFLNDENYLELFIESYKRRKASPRAIFSKLMAKGFSRSEIEEKINELYDDPTEAIRALFMKKCKNPGNPKEFQAAIRYLLSRGFSYSQVQNAGISPQFEALSDI